MRWLRSLILSFCVMVAIISWLGSLAPKDITQPKPVPVSSVQWDDGSGNPCGSHGEIVKATLISVLGPYKSYNLTCSDGVIVEVAR
jgi:hypothetical protein